MGEGQEDSAFQVKNISLQGRRNWWCRGGNSPPPQILVKKHIFQKALDYPERTKTDGANSEFSGAR